MRPVVNGNLSEDLRVRVNEETRKALEELAEREERSVAQVIRRFVREGLERSAEKEEVVA